jgi:hypothetical protein
MNKGALQKALGTLREVTRRLNEGVDKAQFEQEFGRKYVSPGVSVHQYVEQLRISGSLEETADQLKLKDQEAVHATAAA